MSTQMIIRIDPEMKDRLTKVARLGGKTTSQLVRELIEEHIKERDIGAYVDDLWTRIGARLRSKGTRRRDVEKVVREVRKAKP